MAEKNGTVWKILGFALALIGVAVTVIYGYATMGHTVEDQGEDIAEMKPDVKQNTEHRIKFEEKVNTMADSIETIRRAVE